MDVRLEVLLSCSIKRRKPWPRFIWLGREKEGVFLLDDSRISEIHLVSGQTKKKIPKLQPLLQTVVMMSGAQNGVWLAGLLVSGELFLWNKDKDSLKMVSAEPAVQQLASSIKGSGTAVRLSLLVSETGHRVFLAAHTGQVFLWECLAPQDLSSPRDNNIKGRWSQITYPENTKLPSSKDKEASIHSVFVKNQAVGDVCFSAFVFSAEDQLTVTFLKIQWEETWVSKLCSVGFSVDWVSQTYPFSQLQPACKPVKSRGALVPAFTPDAQLLAVVLNQKDPRATQVLFISTQNFVTVSSPLGGCGSKNLSIPAKYVRSYWVGSVSWSPEGLYLACVLKRGSLLMLARLGGLVSLSTTGCNIEFGPAHFLPLHPLVTYRPPVALQTQDNSCSSSSVSLRDPMRQRYSVTWHPRQPVLIVSDGYMVTVLRMPRRPSAAAIMSVLLLDAAQGLEDVRKILASSQSQIRSRMESMPTLTLIGSLLALKEKETPLSTLPLYLQDTGDTGDLRQFSERDQGEEDNDSDEDLYVRSHMEDGGRLEFASMFDTLHARTQRHPEDTKPIRSALQEDLNRVQKILLNAWALGVSVGGAMEQRERLLKYTVLCVSRLTHLLRVSDSSGRGAWVTRAFHILQTLFSFLPWDATRTRGDSCLCVTVELVRGFVELFLPLSSSDSALSSHNFSAALHVLQEASQSLDQTYSLPARAMHHGEDSQLQYRSDIYSVPLLHDDTLTDAETTQTAQSKTPASNRLVFIWREVFRRALQYQAELHKHKGQEQEKMMFIIAQIQRALQRAGDRLEESHELRHFTGEQHFIFGEYSESARVWRAELFTERERAGPLTCYLETRYCLALLYGQLYQYRLREAQGMCDGLARQLQTPAGQEEDRAADVSDELMFDGWFPEHMGREAVCAVIQSLGRFMAAYFTNHPLCILPPHSVDVLPPLHITHDTGGRVVELSRSRVAAAVRSQQLSEVWTVDYALELLLLGGLIPEAVWMARCLGDWKMAATLGLAYKKYCGEQFDLSSLRWRELSLPTELQPAVIFQNQLEALLSQMFGTEGDESTVGVEDVDLVQVSVQEILKASVMAEVDVISEPLTRLLDSAKERATSLPVLVPPVFYLPAPPLYCPQPALNTQDSVTDGTERELRSRVSGLLQKVLLIFRAARGARPAAQWYINSLHQCRLLLQKIRKKSSEPKADTIPEGLKKFTTRHGFFVSRPNKDMDSVTTQTIICFRELCALCWMLHARDQLTVCCRRFQTARRRESDSQVSDGSVADLCVESLRWACRLLPFCRFLNAEEVLQDLVLSLVSELPPSTVIAETLGRVFPDEEESVRVPLREKYTSLVQRLRPLAVPDTNRPDTQAGSDRDDTGADTMMILIQDQLRQRRQDLRRVVKYLGPPEQFLWEREEEEDRGAAASILQRLSLGASLSDSTLTDCGRPLVYSEGDTADTLSEPLSPDLQSRTAHSSKAAKFQDVPDKSTRGTKADKSSKSGEPKEPESAQAEPNGPSLPTVGTWTFELEDEEYTLFLELFLSYVLEKDVLDGEDSELPLLSSFSQQLRTKELHSVTFDLLTTLKRRQKDGRQTGRKRGAQLPLFRAGHCFQILPVTPDLPSSTTPAPSVHSDVHTVTNTTSARALPGLNTGKHSGLFGLRHHAALTSNEVKVNLIGSEASVSQSSLPVMPQVESWTFKIVSRAEQDVQVQLDSALEARFPQLARLLEWMMRWADRRALLSQPIRKKSEGSSDSVVIRARASTPAVLSALQLLEQRYTAALLGENRNTHLKHRSPPAREMEGSGASSLQPNGWKRERESSVDTGYPASAETPITLPDLDVQRSPSPDVSEPEEVMEERVDAQLSEGMDSVSDLQNNSPEDDGSSESSWLSTNQSRAHRDQALTLADLEHQDTNSQHSQSEGHVLSCGMLGNTPVTSEQITAPRSEVCVSECVQHAGPASTPVTQSAGHPPNAASSESTAQTQTQADPVRQLLQDELFRLVQLQQINFMSLMQVVGASFTNLPLSQTPHMLQTRSNVVLPQSSSATHPESTHTPPQNTQHSEHHVTRASGPEPGHTGPDNTKPAVRVNSGPEPNQSHQTDQRHLPLKTQEFHQLSIRSDWTQDSQTDGRTFIPTSQGLLTTANTHTTSQTPPAGVSDSHAYFTPPLRAAPLAHGLRLLQLHPPQPALMRTPALHHTLPPPVRVPVREAWGPRSLLTPSHANFLPNQYESSSIQRAEDTGRRFPPSSDLQQTQRTRGREEPLHLPPAPLRAAPAVGLPLLRFHPDAQPPVTLPRIPQSTTVKPLSLGVAPVEQLPRLQLLHKTPDPPSTFRVSTPALRPPRLIPLEELLTWAAARQTGPETKLQLLKTDAVRQNQNTSSPSSRRRKRREEKREENTGVTFRPEDSIIPPDECVLPAEEESAQNDGYAFPLGVFDSELSGQSLLNQAYVTSAELHAYASSQKRPPEIQDACTNTEAEPSRSIMDKAVSVQFPAPEERLTDVPPVVPPDVFLNLRFSSNQLETESVLESNTDITSDGRRFINVIDLTDDSLLENLLPAHTPTAPPTPHSPPSSALLHLLAATVINPTPEHTPDSALNSAPVSNEPFTAEPAEELPGVCVESESVLSGDPVTLSVLTALKVPPTRSVDPTLLSNAQISARLSAMDAQLVRLQNIADNIDREFTSTRLLVNTIESPAVMSSVDHGSRSRPLRVLQEVRSYSPSQQHCGAAAEPEREDEEVLSSSVINRSSFHQEQLRSSVTPEHTRTEDTNQDLMDKSLLENPGKLAEETLDVSGLSDVKDILAELIRDGALSRSALGLSAAASLSRSELKQHRAMMEEERRDLRVWMRRKQRERLVEYRKQRQEKRERERRPFTSLVSHNPTSVELATNQKIKQERDRTVLLEHHEQRARDACRLITDLLGTPINPCSDPSPTNPQQTLRCVFSSAPVESLSLKFSSNPNETPEATDQDLTDTLEASNRGRGQSSGKTSRGPRAQTGPHGRSVSSLGKTVVIQRKSTAKTHDSLRNRLGLHRPVSALPADRLSQVTRRGMLTKANHQKQRNGLHESSVKQRAVKENDRTHLEETEDRDVVSPWNPPAEVRRILGLEDQDIKQGLEMDDQVFSDVNPLLDLDGLDALSESTSSILSKLDWAAIEKLVAGEEDI